MRHKVSGGRADSPTSRSAIRSSVASRPMQPHQHLHGAVAACAGHSPGRGMARLTGPPAPADAEAPQAVHEGIDLRRRNRRVISSVTRPAAAVQSLAQCSCPGEPATAGEDAAAPPAGLVPRQQCGGRTRLAPNSAERQSRQQAQHALDIVHADAQAQAAVRPGELS